MAQGETAISVKNLVAGYGDNVIIDHISFDIKEGELTALLGPNGSGKSTLIKAILGILPIAEGEVSILGKTPNQVLGEIGYLPQRFEIDRGVPMTVEEFLSLALVGKHSSMVIDEKLSEVDMLDHKKSLLATLSGGQLQRVLIARSLLNNPKILILDEPEAGIDVASEKSFYSLIKHLDNKHGITILMISHEVDLVFDFADQVICLNKTLVCKGAPRSVLTEAKLKELYGGGLMHHDHH